MGWIALQQDYRPGTHAHAARLARAAPLPERPQGGTVFISHRGMNITLLVVGKTDEKYLQEGIDVYTKRLKHYVNFDLAVIPALKDQKGATPDEVKEREA
ncbi:MAG: 23S rRNA (pseudouridine(1915)-N(3))-methyltransferase RlmH, partial [Bacteroidales bacterium]|nr:23S rRNA (pseudouridine(1915)-N(3))-methyltransferase RlmH [Bacteroidales bacterium]